MVTTRSMVQKLAKPNVKYYEEEDEIDDEIASTASCSTSSSTDTEMDDDENVFTPEDMLPNDPYHLFKNFVYGNTTFESFYNYFQEKYLMNILPNEKILNKIAEIVEENNDIHYDTIEKYVDNCPVCGKIKTISRKVTMDDVVIYCGPNCAKRIAFVTDFHENLFSFVYTHNHWMKTAYDSMCKDLETVIEEY